MWEISNSAQVFATIVSIPIGAGLCLLYDIIRVIRKITTPAYIIDFLLDIIYWIICAFITFCDMLIFSSGEVRVYIFFGLFAGFLAFRFTLSRLFIDISFRLIKLVKAIYAILYKILSKFFGLIFKTLQKSVKFVLRIMKKLLKPMRSLLYNKISFKLRNKHVEE